MIRKLFIRSGIILFWIGLIAFGLYWPKWQIIRYEENSINVFAWGDILDPAVISDFQKETGIKVNLSYYSSNEELIVKLKATGGEGYDLIIPSDYAVNVLIQEDLLKEIDKSKLNFWNEIAPNLTGHFFDPDNRYSIPFEWELFGFGIDKDYFADKPMTPSWKMIFDPEVVKYKITMKNDPIEAIEFASFYLFGPVTSINQEQAEQVKAVLKRQKPWVEAYADFRGDYFLATKNCAVVIASSSYIWRTMRMFDFVGFVVPEEGSFITIENLCIPKPSNKDDLTYRFINYLYTPESVASHYETYGFFPAALKADDIAHIDKQASEILRDSEKNFSKYHFCQNILPQDEIRDIWVDVKSGDF
jgi:spermidine/putrescine transport system substrate-binding protein